MQSGTLSGTFLLVHAPSLTFRGWRSSGAYQGVCKEFSCAFRRPMRLPLSQLHGEKNYTRVIDEYPRPAPSRDFFLGLLSAASVFRELAMRIRQASFVPRSVPEIVATVASTHVVPSATSMVSNEAVQGYASSISRKDDSGMRGQHDREFSGRSSSIPESRMKSGDATHSGFSDGKPKFTSISEKHEDRVQISQREVNTIDGREARREERTSKSEVLLSRQKRSSSAIRGFSSDATTFRKRYERHPSQCHTSFIRCMLHGSARERRDYFERIRCRSFLPDVEELDEVLTSLSRQRRTGEAIEVIQCLEEPSVSRAIKLLENVKTCTILIDIFGKARQLARAFTLFYDMQRRGVHPNVITYNALITACGRSNELDLAFEVFEEMEQFGIKPDKYTYGSLIDSCAKCGEVDRAFEISDLMEDRGEVKDQTIYSALMNACGRTEQLDRAFSVFEDMKRNGVWPNLITFSVLIDTCANARQPHRAFELFSEVRHWGYPVANVVVYTSLIDACSKAGWPEKAQLVFESMIENGVKPNEITYGALIDGWGRAGEFDRALKTLRAMTEKHNVRPNSVLLGGLTESARRFRFNSRAKELWEIMVRYNIRPARIFYPGLVAMAAKNNDIDVAIGITFHAFARGALRRCSVACEDPGVRALAYAIILLRHQINSTKDKKVREVRQSRMEAVYSTTSMTESFMNSVETKSAYEYSVSWGDSEPERPAVMRRRSDLNPFVTFDSRRRKRSASVARRARDRGLRELQGFRELSQNDE